jgi:hypothetical protein
LNVFWSTDICPIRSSTAGGYSEDWEIERNYIREDKVLGSMELAMSQAAS